MSARFSVGLIALVGAASLIAVDTPESATVSGMRTNYVVQCVFILEDYGSVGVSGSGATPVAARLDAEGRAGGVNRVAVVGYGGCLITP
ncbi:hypothetical protein [Actinoplanes awajinensis]|uniref:hypothetical protein n=1 Tax=Actinoplanes awajinensis TaxID=135946 RepID=UPI000B32C45C|nr:hypothetical protein [Actinoplanes awajinensis]